MSVTPEETAHAAELFAPLGEITTRKMMGGACLYHHGTIFAMLHPDRGVMLKGAGAAIAALEDAGATRWTYCRDGDEKDIAMPYWSLPEDALDDPETACDWARRVLEHL